MVETFAVGRAAIGHIWPAIAVLRSVCNAAGVNFFVIGAAARDLLLEHVYGVKALRATTDVDVAVAVRDWAHFKTVTDHLVVDQGFARTRVTHRFRRSDLIVDLVPFGEIGGKEALIAWPDDTRVMSVRGFDEAYQGAVGIIADEGAPFRVASLPGLGILKLLAWGEVPRLRPQDPVDLCAIMTSYDEVVGDRLYTDHADLLEANDFDLRVASSRIYGRDVAPLLRTAELRLAVLSVLEANTNDDLDSALVNAMGSECVPDFVLRLRCLRAFLQGISDVLGAVGHLRPETRI